MKLNLKASSVRMLSTPHMVEILANEEDVRAALLQHPKILRKWITDGALKKSETL